MGALTDPDTAARRREYKHALYYTTQTKATSTLTSRLLLEGGYSTNVEYYTGRYQPGIEQDARHRRTGSRRPATKSSSATAP